MKSECLLHVLGGTEWAYQKKKKKKTEIGLSCQWFLHLTPHYFKEVAQKLFLCYTVYLGFFFFFFFFINVSMYA